MASRTYSLVEEWRRKTCALTPSAQSQTTAAYTPLLPRNYQLTQEDQKALTACSLRRSRLQGVGLLGGLGLGLLISGPPPPLRLHLRDVASNPPLSLPKAETSRIGGMSSSAPLPSSVCRIPSSGEGFSPPFDMCPNLLSKAPPWSGFSARESYPLGPAPSSSCRSKHLWAVRLASCIPPLVPLLWSFTNGQRLWSQVVIFFPLLSSFCQ